MFAGQKLSKMYMRASWVTNGVYLDGNISTRAPSHI